MILASSSANVTVTQGVLTEVPKGYVVSNLDPTFTFNSTLNNEIYDPNFLPGFGAGLTNTSVSWSSGNGYGNLSYSIGPWSQEQVGLPHFAVGPQCCNFAEIPHTQQYRRVEWGDYYYVKGGFSSPGVNAENYTTNFSAPAYVGLRRDWNWSVQVSLDWKPPVLMNPGNEWGAIGIAITQYVPGAPGNLVYSLVNFWMDGNSSSTVTPSSDGIERRVVPPNLAVYHPTQITGVGNETIMVDISPYLEDTLRVLGLQNISNQPPVISYVYLNVEGYNFEWNTTLWSFKVMSQSNNSALFTPFLVVIDVLAVAVVSVTLFYLDLRKHASARPQRQQLVGQGQPQKEAHFE
jgi:hypothetical protein